MTAPILFPPALSILRANGPSKPSYVFILFCRAYFCVCPINFDLTSSESTSTRQYKSTRYFEAQLFFPAFAQPARVSSVQVNVNLAGLPALVVPCGLDQGLPVGLQLVGRAFGEVCAPSLLLYSYLNSSLLFLRAMYALLRSKTMGALVFSATSWFVAPHTNRLACNVVSVARVSSLRVRTLVKERVERRKSTCGRPSVCTLHVSLPERSPADKRWILAIPRCRFALGGMSIQTRQ